MTKLTNKKLKQRERKQERVEQRQNLRPLFAHLEEMKKAYERGEKFGLVEGLGHICSFFESKTGHSTKWLQNAIDAEFGKRLETEHKYDRLGTYVIALTNCGAKPKDAKLFVADMTGEADTTVRSSYNHLKNRLSTKEKMESWISYNYQFGYIYEFIILLKEKDDANLVNFAAYETIETATLEMATTMVSYYREAKEKGYIDPKTNAPTMEYILEKLVSKKPDWTYSSKKKSQ